MASSDWINIYGLDIKDVFSSKPSKGSPYILLYSQRIVNWTLANFIEWCLYVTRPGKRRLITDNKVKAHPFYMAKPSSYGVILCYLTYTILSSTVNYLHTGVADPYAMKWCIYWLAYVLIRWTLKIRRASYSHAYFTTIVRRNLMFGMFLFIISEVMVFFGLFWAYFHSSLNPTYAIGGVWPPANLEVLEWWKWPALSTVLLVYSGATANVFYYSLKTLTNISFFQAAGQVALVKKIISSKIIDITAIFVENNFFGRKLIFSGDLKELLCLADGRTFIKAVKKEVKQFEKYFYYDKVGTLCYELRKHFVIEQQWGYVYYRIRIYYHYIRSKIFTPIVKKSWVYVIFIFEYMAWRLRFVFGGVTYTVAAGVAFVYCQNYEYSHASYDITDGIYGTVFYSLTGLHGLHVIAGVAFLLLMYWRFMTLREDFMRNFYPHFGVTASVWYWHFVDVVWFCVYFIVYIWGSVVIV